MIQQPKTRARAIRSGDGENWKFNYEDHAHWGRQTAGGGGGHRQQAEAGGCVVEGPEDSVD